MIKSGFTGPRVFFVILSVLLLLSVVSLYYKYMIISDYEIYLTETAE
jgi:hypothetical protein